jgi:general secretion pathway protein B
MSFILDALKKSESDRQKTTGPALFEVKITPPKARFPVWAIALAVLLGVNLVIVGWLLFRGSSRDTDTAADGQPAANSPPPAQLASAPAPATYQSPLPNAPPAVPPAPPVASGANGSSVPPQAVGGNFTAGAVAPSTAPAQGAQEVRPPQAVSSGGATTNTDSGEPTLAGNVKEPSGATNDGASTAANPDDYTPATEPGTNSLFKSHVRRGTESGFPLYQDAAVQPGANLPNLRLDLHVYAAKPQDRFALINMRKLHEGDSLPEGVKVEAITPDGVIMSHNGSKFLLPRD